MKILTGALLFFILCASGYVDTTDAEPSLDTAKALLNRGTWAVYPGVSGTYFAFRNEAHGPDRYFYRKDEQGNWYSKMGFSMPLLYLPCVVLAQSVSQWLTLAAHEEIIIRFLVSLVNPTLAAVLFFLLFNFFRREGLKERTALFWATGFTLGTSLWPYAKMAHREIAQALCITASYYFIRPATNNPRAALLAGLFTALGTLTKLAFGVMALPVMLLILTQPQRGRSRFYFFLPLIAAALFLSAYSWFTASQFFITGYSPAVNQFHANAWRTPFAVGFAQQIFSWRTGLFIYSPFLLVTFFPWLIKRPFPYWNRWRISLLSSILLQAVLYSAWASPLGNEALGPRYLVSTLPLFALLWDKASVDWVMSHRTRYRATVMLGVLSVFWQLIFTSVKAQEYWYLKAQSTNAPTPPQWLVLSRLFQHKLTSTHESYSLGSLGFTDEKKISLDRFETLRGFNYWWAHAHRLFAAKGHRQSAPDHPPTVSQMNDRPEKDPLKDRPPS